MNTPTPRTDACAKSIDQSNFADEWKDDFEEFAWVPADFARTLETELTAAREQCDKLAEALENCREDSIELLGERDWWQLENRGDYQQRYQTTRDNVTHADAALQSLIKP